MDTAERSSALLQITLLLFAYWSVAEVLIAWAVVTHRPAVPPPCSCRVAHYYYSAHTNCVYKTFGVIYYYYFLPCELRPSVLIIYSPRLSVLFIGGALTPAQSETVTHESIKVITFLLLRYAYTGVVRTAFSASFAVNNITNLAPSDLKRCKI